MQVEMCNKLLAVFRVFFLVPVILWYCQNGNPETAISVTTGYPQPCFSHLSPDHSGLSLSGDESDSPLD